VSGSRYLALLLAAAGAWWLSRGWHEASPSPEQLARSIARRNQLEVGFGDPSTFYVPPASRAGIEGVAVQAADRAQAVFALDGVKQALEVYPADFTSKLIRAVFVAGELTVLGARADGSYGPSWLLIGSSKIRDPDGTFHAAYRALHHELSSFVLKRDADSYAAWTALEPAGWEFSFSGADELKRLHEAAPDPATGFISGYGSTSPENDFNSYAEAIFADSEKLTRLAAQSARVREKLDFVIERYLSIEPNLRVTFERLGVLAH
jgi:hypothetical protein